jgi:hypothetical protein
MAYIQPQAGLTAQFNRLPVGFQPLTAQAGVEDRQVAPQVSAGPLLIQVGRRGCGAGR